jgi:hypothetical protein
VNHAIRTRTRVAGRTAIAGVLLGAALIAPTAALAAEGPEVAPMTVGSNEDPQNITECPAGTTFAFVDSGEQAADGITVELVYDAGTKTVDFVVTGGVALHAFVKGGPAYNWYDYTGLGGVAHDDGLVAPDNGSGDPAGLSHALVCVEEVEEVEEEPSEPAEEPFEPADEETPSGEVEGATGAPDVTPPATDTAALGGERSGDPSMLLLALAAAAIVGGLSADRARARARR